MSPAADGLLVVDKPSGWTSHDVVARGRRLAGTRKVGHAGTLDPMATGVLLLGIGRATRLLGHLALATKAYDATIRLGQATITDDAEGEVTSTADASGVTDDDVERACAAYVGDIAQVPSAVSAIKIKGERAYKRARAGEAVDLPARPVTVARFDVLAVRRTGLLVDVDVHVDCSTGTYIRALARDVGSDLGVGGHLTALRRTRVGPYELIDSHPLEALAQLEPEHQPVLSMASVAAANFATFEVATEDEFAVRNGRALQLVLPTVGTVAMMTSGGDFLALYAQDGPIAKPVAVFPAA